MRVPATHDPTEIGPCDNVLFCANAFDGSAALLDRRSRRADDLRGDLRLPWPVPVCGGLGTISTAIAARSRKHPTVGPVPAGRRGRSSNTSGTAPSRRWRPCTCTPARCPGGLMGTTTAPGKGWHAERLRGRPKGGALSSPETLAVTVAAGRCPGRRWRWRCGGGGDPRGPVPRPAGGLRSSVPGAGVRSGDRGSGRDDRGGASGEGGRQRDVQAHVRCPSVLAFVDGAEPGEPLAALPREGGPTPTTPATGSPWSTPR